ncbi:MAG TPA: hypothetical protein VGM19_02065 [Armatimonadota bacterium]|jgi:hypothetical protein
MRLNESAGARRIIWGLALVATVLLAGVLPVAAQTAAAQPATAVAKPAVLFVSGPLGLSGGGFDLRKNMARISGLGYRVQYATFPGLAGAPADFFEQFDVVVMLEQPTDPYTKTDKGLAPSIAAVHQRIKTYLQGGGGVLMFLMFGYQEELDQLISPYGVNMLTGAYVDANQTPDRLGVFRCAYAPQHSTDPRAAGVTGLWYPVSGKPGDTLDRNVHWGPTTDPFDVDANWTVLASGGPGTQFVPFGKGSGAEQPFQQQPRLLKMTRPLVPLVAVREGVEGQGRLAVCGIDMGVTDFCAGNTLFSGFATGQGLEGKQSDLDRLLMNVVDWMGQASRATGRQTIAASVPASYALEQWHFPTPITNVTTKDRPYLANPDQYVGLIGARTTYSGGKSTVAEYAQAARALGLQYLVFLEDFETLKDDQWDKFKQECEAHSDDKLILIPGIRLQTERGVNFFGFRSGLKLPQPGFLVAGTRKLAQRLDQTFGEASWGEDNGPRHGLACGNFRLEEKFPSGILPENYNVYNPWVSLYTYRYGQFMDSMLPAFLIAAARTEWVSPCTVNLVDSAAELRTEWASDHFKTVYLRDAGLGLKSFGENLGDRGYFLPASYVTNGPKIEEWRSSNLDTAGGFWDWAAQRWFVRMAVSSEAGLKEIVVMNGTKPMYRFLPAGAKRFAQELVLTHNDMHNLILQVTDNAGRQAVSDEEWDKNQLFQLTWCADRNNMLSYSGLPAPQAASGNTGGNYSAPNSMEKNGFRETLLPSVNQDRSRLPHFDGQPNYMASVYPAPNITAGTEQELGGRVSRAIGRELCSPDVAIQTAGLRQIYDPSVKIVHPWLQGPVVPMSLFNADLKYITFSHAGHQPAPVILEGSIKILKDLTFGPDQRMGISVLTMQAWNPLGGYDTAAIQHSSTGDLVTKMSFTDPHVASADGAFNKGAYIWFYPSAYGSAGLFSLQDDLIYSYRNRWVGIGFDTAGKTFKAGTVLKYRIVAMISGFDELPATQLPERFRTAMGLAAPGQTGYKITVEQGRIMDQDYLLRIDGQGKGFAGEIAWPPNALPVSLPIVVENLNDRWTSVLYDRTAKRLRPLGGAGGRAYAHRALDESQGKLFLGHPFTLDQANLNLSAVQTGPQEITLQINNPTDAPVTTKVTRAPQFDFVTNADFPATIPAGSMVEYVLTGATVTKAGG